MVLMILANMGQITNNIVARNIHLAKFRPANLQQVLSEDGVNARNMMATDQSAPLENHNGVRDLYAVGMYGHCGGKSLKDERACTTMGFGYILKPGAIIQSDLPESAGNVDVTDLFNRWGVGTYSASHWQPAFYLAFLGTIFVGVAFLVTCLIHMSALVVAAIFAFLAFLLLGVAASLWTADMYALVQKSPIGLEFSYGNLLWFTWAACGSTLLGLPALLTSSYAGRTHSGDGYEHGEYY